MKKYLFFLALVFLSLPISVKAETNPFQDFKLPHPLPYTFGGETYTHVQGFKHTGSYDWWVIYHNEDNLLFSQSFGGFNPDMTDNVCFYISDIRSPYSGDPNSSCNGTVSLGGVPSNKCIYNTFSDYTQFFLGDNYTGQLDTDLDCTNDDIDHPSGSVAVPRTNFSGVNFGAPVSPDYSNIIDGQLDDEYVDVPNPLTDPKGFVIALLTNLALWVKNLFIPSTDFFQTKYNEMKLAFEEKFAFYFQLKDAYTIPIETTPSAFSFTGLSFGGVTLPTLTLFNGFSFFDFGPYRTFISGIMYASCGLFVIRKMSRIFSS